MKNKKFSYILCILCIHLLSPNFALSKLKLIHPNGGEIISKDKAINIVWEGVDSSESITIEYSIDKGQTWNFITNDASGFNYNWENIPSLNSNNCLLRLRSNLSWDSTNININEIEYQKQSTFDILGWDEQSSRLITISQVTNYTLSHLDTSSKKLEVIKNDLEFYINCTISPDNKKILGLNAYGKYGIFSASTGNTICSFNNNITNLNYNSGNAFAWSPDSKLVAVTAYRNKVIYIHNATTGELVDSAKSAFNSDFYGFELQQLNWSNDDKLLTLTTDSHIYTWETKYFQNVSSKGFLELIKSEKNRSVKVSPNAKYVCSLSENNRLSIYDLVEKKTKTIYLKSINNDNFQQCNWNSESNRISFNTYDSVLNIDIYDLDKDTIYDNLPPITIANDIVWSIKGQNIADINDKWGNNTKLLSFKFDSIYYNPFYRRSLNYSPDGRYIANSQGFFNTNIFNSENGELIFTIEKHKVNENESRLIQRLVWHTDSDKIIINADSGNIDIYSISQKKVINRIPHIYSYFTNLQTYQNLNADKILISKDGKYLMTLCGETMLIINLENNKLVKSMQITYNYSYHIYDLNWNSDLNQLAVNYVDYITSTYKIDIIEFDLTKNQGLYFNQYKKLFTFEQGKKYSYTAELLSNGEFIIFSTNNILKYNKDFKLKSNTPLDSNEQLPIQNVFTKDYNMLISSQANNIKNSTSRYDIDKIRIYNAKTGKTLGFLKENISNNYHSFFSLSTHPYKKQFAISSEFGLKVYNMNYSFSNEDLSDAVFTIESSKSNTIDENQERQKLLNVKILDNILNINKINYNAINIEISDLVGRRILSENLNNIDEYNKELPNLSKNSLLFLKIQYQNSNFLYKILNNQIYEVK